MSTASYPVSSVSYSAPRVAVSTATSRFVFLDGLRGLAALAVCCYHIERYAPQRDAVAAVLPGPITEALRHGWCGVQVFFVISGFVIAYSLRNAVVTPRYLGEFLTRRTLRLTPPYLAIVAVGLLLGFAPELFGLPSGCDEPISWGQAATHLLYLQNICGYENLSAGFWTLCIEMQFYALFVLLLGLAHRLPFGHSAVGQPSPWSLAVIGLPLGLASLYWWSVTETLDAWVIHFWALFLAGALAWWVHNRQLPAWLLWSYLGAMAMRLLVVWTDELFAALVAGMVVLVAAQTGGLSRWLSATWLQHLGRISYSLYLVHFPISHVLLNFGSRWTGDGTASGLLWMAASVGVSFLAAEVFYVLVEQPCVRWSSGFGRSTTMVAPSKNRTLLA